MVERTRRFASIWILLLASGVIRADSGLLPVWDIESPVFNALGGSYNAYGSDGCDLVLQRTQLMHRGPAGHSLKVRYTNSNAASCGFWIHLFKEGVPVGNSDFPDMNRFRYLSFWINEDAKPQDVQVRMADSIWLSRDDSKVAGPASRYLGQLSGGGWREVIVPFPDFQLPGSKAAVIALQFGSQTSGVIYIDDICLKTSAEAPSEYSGPPAPSVGATRRRAMWLWETTTLLRSPERQRDALTVLREARVTDLFLQIPRRKSEDDDPQLELKAELRSFLKTTHANGLRVHALDGFPEFSLKERHRVVVSLVRTIIAYNLSSSPEERFDGIHLDNEPYQLLGFEGPSRREIFQEYLELNQKVAALLRNEAPGLAFGVDIPFWWDATGDRDHPCCLVTFNGADKSAARQIIDLVDNVGIMAYRNFAGGMDGIINHAQSNVNYAGEKGKQSFVAVETYRSPPMNVTFVAAIKESQWQALPAQSSLLRLSQWQGYPLRGFTDGRYRFIGLADKDSATARTTYADAVGMLHAALPGSPADWVSDLREFQGSFERYGRTSGEWRGASLLPQGKLSTPGGFGISVIENMPAKITLADKTRGFVNEILLEVAEAFDRNPGFTGDAIHSLESYQELNRK